jgi:hypothetical protein
VQIIIVTDPIEGRRARLAQFQVRISTMELAGQTVCGIVESVTAITTNGQRKWIVRLLPKLHSTGQRRRYDPHKQQFVTTTISDGAKPE